MIEKKMAVIGELESLILGNYLRDILAEGIHMARKLNKKLD